MSLDQTYDHGERDFEQVLELSQKATPIVILDIPHTWDAWVRHTLATIDEIVIVAEPDLANLRNAKNLSDTIKALRPTESAPLLVINKLGMPRRPEISATEFREPRSTASLLRPNSVRRGVSSAPPPTTAR